MADFEILVADVDTSNSVYFVLYNSAAEIANQATETFGTPTDASWASYDVAMTQLGTNTNTYRGDIPSWITTGGTYFWVAYEQLGVSPVVTDDILASGLINWTGSAVAGGAIPAEEGNLFTLAEYKTYKGITSTDATRDATLSYLISAVSAGIKGYLDHAVVAATRDELYLSNGAFWINVNNYPIVSITSVVFDYGSDSPETISGGEFVFNVGGNNGTIMFNPNSEYTRRFTGHIRVQYSAGYTYELRPEDLKLAGMLWVDLLKSRSDNGLGLASESLGDYSYSLRDTGDNIMPMEIKTLLTPYKRPGLL